MKDVLLSLAVTSSQEGSGLNHGRSPPARAEAMTSGQAAVKTSEGNQRRPLAIGRSTSLPSTSAMPAGAK